MFGFQTVSCLHDIPVVRSSTDKLQDVYAKAKDSTVLIRLPCNVAETVADTSVRATLTVLSPLLKPLLGPVRAIDDYAARKIRQMESKYPVINTPTEDVVNTITEKTEPVRNAMNSVKDSTTSTIQQGKDTVSNVATATVNKASGVADSLYSFCESHVSDMQRRNSGKPTGLYGFAFSTIFSLLAYAFQTVQSSLMWFRMLVVFFLLKSKQINDLVLNKVQRKAYLTSLPQRLLIVIGTFLEYFIGRIRPDDRTLAELKKSKQQSRYSQQPRSNQQPQYFANRPGLKPDPSLRPRQNVIVTKQETVITRTSDTQPPPDYSNLTDTEELYARLANNGLRRSVDDIDDDEYVTDPVDVIPNRDIADLHAHVKPTDVELLYSRLPADILPVADEQETLNPDQQQLHARIIGTELERQGYQED